MKKFIFLVLIYLSVSKLSFSSNLAYETNFYNVDINSELIEDVKIKEINNIKRLSFENILHKILTEDNFNKFNKSINANEEINYIIKNILIEDEFVSSNKYKAKIKVNFDYKEIVKLLRTNKINYTDYISSNFLVVVAESVELLNNGLSKNNSFYNKKIKTNFDLINIKYPDLSINDRFILPYNKIIKKDLLSLRNIAIKYDTDYIFVILFNQKNNIYKFNISVYSIKKNQLDFINELIIESDLNYQNILFDSLNNWWKNNNLINNSIQNNLSCILKNSNLHELKFMNNKINSISQVKSNKLKQISLNANIQDIVYYGDLTNLSSKLIYEKIKIEFNNKSECIISTTN